MARPNKKTRKRIARAKRARMKAQSTFDERNAFMLSRPCRTNISTWGARSATFGGVGFGFDVAAIGNKPFKEPVTNRK